MSTYLGEDHQTSAVRLVLTDEAAAAFARLKEARKIATMRRPDGRPGPTTRRAVPVREVYELVICAFLERERAGEPIVVLYPPESASRRVAWIDSKNRIGGGSAPPQRVRAGRSS